MSPRLFLRVLYFVLLSAPALTCVAKAPNLERGDRISGAGVAQEPNHPPMEVSEEATADQLDTARRQGLAAERAVDYMLTRQSAYAAQMQAGNYVVALSVTGPVGWYEWANEKLNWHEPSQANAHVRVYVRDAGDGRVIPELKVRALVFKTGGVADAVTQAALPYGWHPLADYYGENLTLPEDTKFTLRVEIEAPTFRRHDPVNGDRYGEAVWLEFRNVQFSARAAAASPLDQEIVRSLQSEQARALRSALALMMNGVAVDGAYIETGDYLVAYAVEFAEGYWHMEKNTLRYSMRAEASAERNAHVEVAVIDRLSGQVIPSLLIETALLAPNGDVVGEHRQSLMWHPWLYHYGRNWRIPRAGRYTLRIRSAPPRYRRYDQELGARLADPIRAEFTGVKLQTGEK